MKINSEVMKNAFWILIAAITMPIFLYQQYNKIFNNSNNQAEISSPQSSSQTTRVIIQEIAKYSEINSKKLMNIALTRDESENYDALKVKYNPFPKNLEGEFNCRIYSLPDASAIANGNLECVADANFYTRLIISFIDKNKTFEYFKGDTFTVTGKVTDIKIPTPDEIREVELNNLNLHEEFPTIVYISGNPILRKN